MLIQTERLTLRPFSDGDREAMYALLTDSAVKETYLLPDFKSTEQLETMFRRFQTLSCDEDRCVAAIDLGGALIGFVNDVEIHDGRVEMGYVVSPAHHNCGYATEALRGVIAALFQRGFREVVAGAFESNPASIRVMIKAGMTRLDKTDNIEYRGRIHRCIYYSIRST